MCIRDTVIEKFCVEDRSACGAANRVVAAEPELVVEHCTGLNRSNDNSHAVAAVAVESRLWPFNIALHEDRRARCAGQFELIDRRTEIADRALDFITRSLLTEFYGNGFKMSVAHVDAMRLSAHANRVNVR